MIFEIYSFRKSQNKNCNAIFSRGVDLDVMFVTKDSTSSLDNFRIFNIKVPASSW